MFIATGSLTVQYILDKFRTFNRPQQEGLLEWARLNVQSIEAFFEACIRNTLFSKKSRALYEPMRMIAVRVLNRFPIEIPACEETIAKYQREAVRQAQATIQYLDGEINALVLEKEAAEREKEALEARIQRGKIRERTEGKGPAQPPPRQRTAVDNVLQHLQPQPAGIPGAGRRGDSPARRARDMAGLREIQLPLRDPEAEGPWRDPDEDPKDGRAKCERPAAPSAGSESRTVSMKA